MTTPRVRRIWIVNEGSPGHLSQSAGLAEALAKVMPVEVTRIDCPVRPRGFVRTLARMWMGENGRSLPEWLVGQWAGPVPSGIPDLILSSGGKSVFVARSLAVRHGVPYVFSGERKPFPGGWFHSVFTPSALENGAKDLPVEMIPTRINGESVRKAAAGWQERPDGRLWAAVIGGTSVSHRYAMEDWGALAAAMNRVAELKGIRWLVTTSPRTGAQVEGLLRERLNPGTIAAAVWWAEKPERKMAEFLGAAERVVVTQDSVTMVTEAVASGRPVVVVRPARVEFADSGFLPGYFSKLESAGRIIRMEMDQLSVHVPEDGVFQARLRPVEEEIIARLLPRLGWEAIS